MTQSVMEKERNRMTKKILQLTLEIIYLLTGEVRRILGVLHDITHLYYSNIDLSGKDYGPLKKSNDHHRPGTHQRVSGGLGRTQSMEPPLHCITPVKDNVKILQLTSQITQLLTEEVPIRCQDVTVYFSTEEWQYVEGHKDLYKDIMEAYPTLGKLGDLHDNEVDEDDLSIIKKEPISDEEHLLHPDISSQKHDTRLSPIHNKEENFKTEEHLPPSDVSSDNFTQSSPIHIKEEPISTEEHLPHPDISAPTLHHIQPLSSHVKEKALLVEIPHLNTLQYEKVPVDGRECSLGSDQHVMSNFLVVQTNNEDKPYGCCGCGKSFESNTELTKPYYCDECGKCFISKSCLTKHRKYHSRVKPFSCPECGKSFLKKSDLSRHFRIHTGERPYSCSYCGKRFIQRANLLLHERTHTGHRPYSCAQCGKGFHCKTALAKHETSHTQMQVSYPETSSSSQMQRPPIETNKHVHF